MISLALLLLQTALVGVLSFLLSVPLYGAIGLIVVSQLLTAGFAMAILKESMDKDKT
jgi:heme A synthase